MVIWWTFIHAMSQLAPWLVIGVIGIALALVANATRREEVRRRRRRSS